MPCSIADAKKCTEYCAHMLTKCKPVKGKANDPVYRIRGQFLDFLFESYKASVNNRYPSRTGQINLINDFIAKMIHQYLFGQEEQLHYTDGKRIFYHPFPLVKGNL